MNKKYKTGIKTSIIDMDNLILTKLVTCMACGWVGSESEVNNWEHEPPTCAYCESAQLSYQPNKKNDK